MTTQSTAEQLKEIFAPLKQKHLTPQDEASLKEAREWASGPEDVKKSLESIKQLMQEARTLMTSGDPTTAAAMDFARRFRTTSQHLKSMAPSYLTDLSPKFKAMMDDARSDPDVSQKLEVFAFVEKALANLKAQEGDSASEDR